MALSTPLRRLGVVALAAGLLVAPLGPVGPTGVVGAASATECPPLIPCVVPPGATAPPVITGEAKVGETLTATPPTWDQADVTTTYQWLRDGEAIEGATEQTYTLVGDDFQGPVSVRADGANALGVPGSATSEAVDPAKGDPIEPATQPRVTGSATVGGTLTTTSGEWGEPTPMFTYQWYRSRPSGSGGMLIEGATSTSYTPTLEDTGRKLVVLVTAERFGYEKGLGIGNVVSVPRAASTVTVSLTEQRIRPTDQAGVRIVLGDEVGLKPKGKVVIRDGQKVLRTVGVTADDGVTLIRLNRLAPGTHRITARYAGDRAHLPAESEPQVLTVTRR